MNKYSTSQTGHQAKILKMTIFAQKRTMTKAELVAKIAKETGANPKEVLQVIECLMNTSIEPLQTI